MSKPVGSVIGWYGGYPMIELFPSEWIPAVGTVLYSAPAPEQKPVAWTNKNAIDRLTGKMGAVGSPLTWGVEAPLYKTKTPDGVPLYTAPPARKPLTDAEISAIVQSMSAHTWDAHMLARAIERAHGIGDD